MTNDPSFLIQQLHHLTQDLLWTSETDAPFEIMEWQEQTCDVTPADLLLLTQHPTDTPIESVNIDDFFAGAVDEQDWFGDEEKIMAEHYRELLATLKQNLHQLRVYRVGDVAIDIYIVGKTDCGTLVGLATKVVET